MCLFIWNILYWSFSEEWKSESVRSVESGVWGRWGRVGGRQSVVLDKWRELCLFFIGRFLSLVPYNLSSLHTVQLISSRIFFFFLAPLTLFSNRKEFYKRKGDFGIGEKAQSVNMWTYFAASYIIMFLFLWIPFALESTILQYNTVGKNRDWLFHKLLGPYTYFSFLDWPHWLRVIDMRLCRLCSWNWYF